MRHLALAALSFSLLSPLDADARTLGPAWKTAAEETDAAPAAAGERSLWLGGHLADSAARLDVYTAYMVDKAKVLEKRPAPAS